MPKSFTDAFHIDKKIFELCGALDIILDVDAKYFIDPALVRICTIPEFDGAKLVIEEYFGKIVTLVHHSKVSGDMYWKKAEEFLQFKEINSTCLGYSNSGTKGNAIGKELRKQILNTIKELLKSGEVDPILFELLGVFQEKIGCDRISDLLTHILKNEIICYTKRINRDLNLKNGLMKNPYNKSNIWLLPKQILTPLPVAEDFDDIDVACSENERVRRDINEYLDLEGRTKLTKSEMRKLLIEKVPYRQVVVSNYKNFSPTEYDFDKDPTGQIIWYYSSKKKVEEYPLLLVPPNDIKEMREVVLKICYRFKKLIEDNGLWRLLYDKKQPKHEAAAQLLYYGIADTYCKANNIDISREVNNGHGPVDFKLSIGGKQKILVEIKLTSNSQLIHGVTKQLPLYMEQEEVDYAIYLIIDNGHRGRLEHFQDYYNSLENVRRDKIEYILVDGNIQESASKA